MRGRTFPWGVLVWAVVASCLAAGCGGSVDELPSPVGMYTFDREAYARALVQEAPSPRPQAPPAEVERHEAQAVAQARREAGLLHMRLALESDGSFVVRFRFGKEEGSYRGTWHREGERVTLVTTATPRGPLGTTTTTVARYRPGGLWFEAGAVPRPFVLRRE